MKMYRLAMCSVLACMALGWVPATAQEGDVPEVCAFPLPLPSVIGVEAFEAKLYAFLDAHCYETLGWPKDKERRDTGPYIQDATTPGGANYGTHPAVLIHYSPKVYEWLRKGRQGEIEDGQMIVKVMYSPPASAENPLSAWTVMSRDSRASWDGWFWAYHAPPSDDSGATGGGLDSVHADIGYPDSGFGLYCLNCHASVDNSQSTYSTLRNIEGTPMTYLVVEPTMSNDPHGPHGATEALHMLKASLSTQGTLSRHRKEPDPEFLKVYDQIPPVKLADVVSLPGEGLDDVLSGPPPAGPQQFLTSSQCIGCHDATQNNAAPPNMIYPAQGGDGPITNLSPYGEWRASMMGLAGRDPIFFAQLESEGNLHPQHKATIQNLCFRCHGVMGQRQLHIDHGEDALFNERMVFARPPDKFAEYGALARDGVSCTVCHHVAAEGLGTPSTFTGQFHVGPPDEIYGPYQDVATLPMKQALGITPEGAPQIQSAALCGSCHAIKLPVYNAEGEQVKETFEQTTYLEWLNSVYQNEIEPHGSDPQTCQSCHMPQGFGDTERLEYRIASIEDDTFPDVDNRAPNAESHLRTRDTYHRHTLYGINLYGIEMFQQYSNQLGIRTTDPMATYGDPVPGLVTAENAGVDLATTATAAVEIAEVAWKDGALEAEVRLANLAGHHFPSGVGFRRAFLTFEVLGGAEEPLWVSGRASDLGILLGADGEPLPSEFFEVVNGRQAYQPHYEVITSEDEAQIYEELVKTCEGVFTTSFLSICRHVKDNRLQPRGWRHDGPYADDTRPYGKAVEDCAYHYQRRCDGPSGGTDEIVYRVPAERAAGATSVRVTLYYQAIPPYFLKQRFVHGENGPDTQRLYAFGSYFNLEGTPVEGWKLEIGSASAAVAAAPGKAAR